MRSETHNYTQRRASEDMNEDKVRHANAMCANISCRGSYDCMAALCTHDRWMDGCNIKCHYDQTWRIFLDEIYYDRYIWQM